MKYIYKISLLLFMIFLVYSCKDTPVIPVDNPGNPVNNTEFIRSVKPEYTDINDKIDVVIENNSKYGGYHIFIDPTEVFAALLSEDVSFKTLQITVPPQAREGKLKFVFQDTVINYRRNLQIIHIENIKVSESKKNIQVYGFGFLKMSNLTISFNNIRFKIESLFDNQILLIKPADQSKINGLMTFQSDYYFHQVQVNLDLRELPSLKISAQNIDMTIHTQNSNGTGQDDLINKSIDIDTKSENMVVEEINDEITFTKPQYPGYSTVKLIFESDSKLSIILKYYCTLKFDNEFIEYYGWSGKFQNLPYLNNNDSISIFLEGQDFISRTSGLYYQYFLSVFKPGHYSYSTQKYSKSYSLKDESYIKIVIKF